MTSEERRIGRRARREAARTAKRNALAVRHDRLESVFSYGNLYKAYKCCRRNVGWKASVQRYITQAPCNVLHTWKQIRAGRYRSPGFYEFDLYERGKHRHIRSTSIGERVVQRCLCDQSIIPMMCRTFIYDNGASMRDKGYDFAVRRLCVHLRKHIHKYGRDGYILLYDFSKFFDHVNHALVKAAMRKQLTDERILKIADHLIDAFGDVGLGLGSQISQVLALASANRLDHFVKEMLRIRGYGRYMDDGYLIHISKEKLRHCLEAMQRVCRELGIKLNAKKTQIVKLSHGFTWLKIRFFITEKGKIVRKIYKRSVCKMRQKLKKLRVMLDEKRIMQNDVYTAFQSWRSYALKFHAYHTVQSISRLYNTLFIFDWRNKPCCTFA